MNQTSLADYLRAEAGRRFALGRADCLTLAADWIRLRRAVDPLGRFRGRYRDMTEACALVMAMGGLAAAVATALSEAGLRPTYVPRPGDVAVVQLGAERAEVCAICTERGWMVRVNERLARLPPEHARPVAAWRV